MNKLFRLALIGLVVAVLFQAINYFSRKQYPIHLPNPQENENVMVLITGCSSGIGYSTALALDQLGYTVIAGVRKNKDAEKLKAVGSSRLHPVILDVTNGTHVEEIFELINKELGDNLYRFGGLVQNAGVTMAWPLETADVDTMMNIFAVNLFGPLNLTRKFLPLLKIQEGRIVFITSVSDFFTVPFLTLYSMSKHAAKAMADGLRRELTGQNVSVSIVAPGVVETNIVQNMKVAKVTSENAGTYYEAAKGLESMMQFTHFSKQGISPEEVAAVIVDALQSSRPKVRYVVGIDAYFLEFLDFVVPDALLDLLVDAAMVVGPKLLNFLE